MELNYTWDERKRLSNLAQHKLDFRDAWQIYEHPDKVTLSDPYPHELRHKDIAEVDGVVWLLVYTMRDEAIRCISFRVANRKERRIYHDQR